MTPDELEAILADDEDPPVRDGRLLTAAVCVAALALWFAAIWFIFGDMI
jgi:hypothetical protein